MNFFDIFAQRLHYLRKERMLTLKQVGDAIESTKATIGNLENGNKKPSVDMLVSLAMFFDVSIDYLTGRTDNPKVNH